MNNNHHIRISTIRCIYDIRTNAGILLTEHLETNFGDISLKNLDTFVQENAFENVCEMSTILFRPQRAKITA